MNKRKIGILLSLAMMLGLASCGEKEVNSKLVLNEVLIENTDNFQDDYGVQSAWIEVFNKSYTSADLAGYQLKMSNQAGDTATYFIPKGDVLTQIKPRQHVLFWADGIKEKGTFHVNFKLDNAKEIFFVSADGRTIVDKVVLPQLDTNKSYARKVDGEGSNKQESFVYKSINKSLKAKANIDVFPFINCYCMIIVSY